MVIGHDIADTQHVSLDPRTKWVLAVVCLGAGVATLGARWIPGDVTRIVYGVILAAIFLGFTLVASRQPALRPFGDLSFAFFIFALVQVLNNSLPGYVATYLLHATAISGNPEASTLAGTVVIQLLQTAIAIIPIIVLTLASGRKLSTIYAGFGRPGWWFALAPLVLIGIYLFSVSPRASRYIPTHSPITFSHHLLALTPALLVLVLSNGFQEEFLFRGLFLKRYQTFFGFGLANVLQALIFAVAHAGITYTTSALLFIVLVVFPLGLALGYLMRKTNGVVTPALIHAGFDIPIYLSFLSYVA